MANTTADKLNLLKQTKADIKTALTNKGQTIDDTTPFSDYAEKINNIDTSSNISSYFDSNYDTEEVMYDSAYEINNGFYAGSGIAMNLKEFPSNITLTENSNPKGLFKDCVQLTTFPSSLPNFTSGGIAQADCTSMFQNCKNLTNQNCPDLSNVICRSAYNMFCGCTSLTSIPTTLQLDAITNAMGMFYSCTSLANVNINFPAAMSASYMFYNCTNLISANFTAPYMTNASYIFTSCTSLITLTLDAPRLTGANYICQYNKNLTSVNLGTTGISTTNGTSFDRAFYECYALQTVTIDESMSALRVSSLYSTFGRLQNLTSIPALDLSKFNSSSTNFSNRGLYSSFANTALTSITFVNMNQISILTEMNRMCSDCEALETINGFELPDNQITDMSNTFKNCTSLTNDFLNTILGQLNKLGSNYTGTKTLKYIGLSETQATTCTTLSNWSTAEAAGWTTGY